MTPNNQTYLSDQLRIINNNIRTSRMNSDNDPVEHRYEQRHDEYTLRSWATKETSVTGPLRDRPAWLVAIIDLALVGGHTHLIPNPPPDLIVWFRTAASSHELLEFVEFNPKSPEGPL